VSGSPYLYLTISQIRELHDSVIQVFEQASAYAYSIVQNSPFMGGNKRTALVAALVFLEINGITEHGYNESLLVQAMLYLAEGKMNVDLFAQFLRDALSGTMGTWEDK